MVALAPFALFWGHGREADMQERSCPRARHNLMFITLGSPCSWVRDTFQRARSNITFTYFSSQQSQRNHAQARDAYNHSLSTH